MSIPPSTQELEVFHARASGHIIGLEVLRRISEFGTEEARIQFLDAIKNVVQTRFCVLCGAETGGSKCHCAPYYDE